jgi:cytochrome c peroxidase
MKLNWIYGIVLLIVGVLYSCKKDQVFVSMTPYTLDIPSHFPQMPIPDDNPMTVEGVELGRHLFYEKKLSRDNTISCASCHFQEHGFSDPSQFSVGVDGAVGDRQSMALVNLGWQTSFFWDGRAGTLEEQILEPIPNPVEMHQEWPDAIQKLVNDEKYPKMFARAFGETGISKEKVTKAIAQFLRTMISGQSKYDVMYKFQNGLALTPHEQQIWENITVEEWAGMDIFFSLSGGDCLHCHDGPLMHVNIFSNNGLDMTFADEGRYLVTGNQNDKGRFKVPTLRNIELTAPYMHDGRFNTLDEVILHYSFGVVNSPTIDPMMEFAHQGGVQLDLQERELLKTFLKTFTDHTFISNPKFAPPTP